MEIHRDQKVSQRLLERVPQYTVGFSPHYDDLVDFFTVNTDYHSDFVPYFMRKFQIYNEPTLATWATETPIDSAIICAFSHCLPQEGIVLPDSTLPETEILARFRFTVSKIHCLDYLDFMIRVINVITDLSIQYELLLWGEIEDPAPLVQDAESNTWLASTYVPPFLGAQSLNSVLDGAANVTKRTGLMMELIGDQYRKVVMDNLKIRPQHVAGSYFIPYHVAQ